MLEQESSNPKFSKNTKKSFTVCKHVCTISPVGAKSYWLINLLTQDDKCHLFFNEGFP